MKIYLVWDSHDLWDIFTTREQAENFIKNKESWVGVLEIEEREIT